MATKALITEITSQAGWHLAELPLANGHEVHGLICRSSSLTTGRIDHLYQDPHQAGARLFLHYAVLTDRSSRAHPYQVEPDRPTRFGGELRWDAHMPDGQPRRALDTSLGRQRFGFEAKTSFEDGLRATVDWHERSETVRAMADR